MCELFGFSAAGPTDIRAELREFYSHSVRHPHGWGMMHGCGTVHEGIRAIDSPRLKKLIDGLGPQKTLLGHIRFATVGSVKEVNCHPFSGSDITGRTWTLIHNGTIYSGSRLIPMLSRQKGDTDSERLFLYLMETVNSAQTWGSLSAEGRFALINDFVKEMAPRNKLNLMIYDGELLYIHKNMKDTMFQRPFGSGVMFATSPVDGGDWSQVPIAQLMAYKDGKKFLTGDRHKGVFVPNLQYITAMDAMNI